MCNTRVQLSNVVFLSPKYVEHVHFQPIPIKWRFQHYFKAHLLSKLFKSLPQSHLLTPSYFLSWKCLPCSIKRTLHLFFSNSQALHSGGASPYCWSRWDKVRQQHRQVQVKLKVVVGGERGCVSFEGCNHSTATYITAFSIVVVVVSNNRVHSEDPTKRLSWDKRCKKG